jgi:hypothetical protein
MIMPKNCSYFAAIYHLCQLCKHSRKYFTQPNVEAVEEVAKGPLRLARPPTESIRPVGKWPGGHNSPVNDIKEVA